jgi:hypothetical protein
MEEKGKNGLLVVVDVQLRVRVSGPCGFEGDRDEAVAEDVGEYTAAEGTVFVEDFVDDVLGVGLVFRDGCWMKEGRLTHA